MTGPSAAFRAILPDREAPAGRFNVVTPAGIEMLADVLPVQLIAVPEVTQAASALPFSIDKGRTVARRTIR